MTQMIPSEIVSELDKNIGGQARAKRAVAIALRTRWRRSQVARWVGVGGPRGRWILRLVNQCLRAGKALDDRAVSPVVRQLLVHWALDPTVADLGACQGAGGAPHACATRPR